MNKVDIHKNQPKFRKQKKLSLWRLSLLIFIMFGVTISSVSKVTDWQVKREVKNDSPWFASYVDVTAMPTFPFDQMRPGTSSDVILSFVVSSKTDACTPSWGGVYTLDEAKNSLDLDRRIARLRQQGGSVAISFGGEINDELSIKCTDKEKLFIAYKTIIDRYGIDTVDLDIEKSGLRDQASAERRATVIARIQAERRENGKNLAVWATLPVASDGLTEEGTDAVSYLLAGGVDLAGVNAMTMNYGKSKKSGESMAEVSKSALGQVHRQLGVLYENQKDMHLNNSTLWSKIGATPMIGQNVFADEVFTSDDAKKLNEFALSQKIGRMSMWSANRDVSCGDNYTNTNKVSDSCSGVVQDKHGFTNILNKGFDGNLSDSSNIITTSDTRTTTQVDDDPSSSPYPIWAEDDAYLEGTKIVWHRNVYKAKWWTQGDIPDNAVLHSWETPWSLVGPVMPGEKPIEQFKLPKGTYPDWSGLAIYEAENRVLFNGVPYQAKWWNQGESPAAASSNTSGSPWVILTQQQHEEQ